MKIQILDAIVEVALVAGTCFLAYNGLDGWGWLIFILIIKN